ncbi:MAG: preprotein translocase subunit YajC [Acutalibacteraceae bacterium]|nr:preprotein translocase subunit YajC [Acutalibacteraceae bacterium]
MFSLAAKTGAAGGNMWVMLVIYAAIFAVFYFVFIRPQNKKKKEEEKMRNNLQIGDEIITIGGFHAKVVSVKEDSIVIESVLDHSKQKLARWAIQSNLTVHDDAPAKK